MRLRVLGIAAMMLSVIGFSNSAIAREAPVAKLVQVEGEVQYSRNGTTWRPVRRTKYLFNGYQIRTGSDGNGKLINQLTGTSQKLGADTHIEIGKQEVQVLAGALSRPTQESTSIWESLMNKFSRAQRYTTVRRDPDGGKPPCDIKVRTIREVAISNDHPELVWRNCGSYKYQLSLDGKTMEVASQDGEFYRHKVSGKKPGEYTFSVTAIAEDGREYTQRKPSTFVWLDDQQASGIREQVESAGDDVFVAAAIYEANGLFVAALDAYREYFAENPDDNDMRPMLVNSYQSLKLSDLRHEEAVVYQKALEEDY
ncbi:MAG: hypothetical protein AAF525_07725 [Pseudomonadota bacterium]